MDKDNLIKVPAEYARVLGRMGLTEYKIVQEDSDGIVISAPVELCRTLLRMGLTDFKDATDTAYLFRKATACADPTIREVILANQAHIKKVSQVGNDCTVELELGKIQATTSPITHLTKKYICLLIRTNFDTIEGATWNGAKLTAADVQDSIDMGGTKQDICFWVAAEDVLGNKVEKTVGKEGYTTEKISVVTVDVTKYNLAYTNEDGFITATFTGANGRTILPGTDVVNVGETVTVVLNTAGGKLIDTVTVGSQTVAVDEATFTAVVSENTHADIAVTAVAEDEPQPEETQPE